MRNAPVVNGVRLPDDESDLVVHRGGRFINNKYVQGRNKEMGVEKMGSDYAALDSFFLYVKDLLDPDVA